MSRDREQRSLAERRAWPWTAPDCFERGSIEADEDDDGFDSWLRVRTPGISLAEARDRRRTTWNQVAGASSRRPLHAHLSAVASAYLERCGGHVRLRSTNRPDRDEPAMARRWRTMALVLPPDLLVAALHADTGYAPVRDDVELVTPHLARVLEDGYAETHLHVGGAMGFTTLWAAYVSSPTGTPTADGGPYGDATASWTRGWAAGVVRYLFAGHLDALARGARSSFQAWVHQLTETAQVRGFTPTEVRAIFEAALDILLAPQANPRLTRAEATTFFDRWIQLSVLLRDESGVLDPLERWLGPGVGACPETRLTTRILRALRRRPLDESLARCFWQYVRVRVRLYRYLIQEPGTPGLDWFRAHFRRIRPFRERIEERLTEHAYEHTRGVGRLHALEVRTSPPSSRQSMLRLAARIAEAASELQKREETREADGVEIGLILHWLKRESPRDRAALPLHSPWQRNALQRADALTWVLSAFPELLLVVRGIDVAGDELMLPTWVTRAPLLRARAAGRSASHRLAATHPSWNAMPLGLTYHAGEDFRRLAQGLRRMHELVEFDLLTSGDRVGHGLALAEDPERLSARRGMMVHQPRGELLEDLLWELDRYASGDLTVDNGRVEHVRERAAKLARRLFDTDHPTRDHVDRLRNARRERADAVERAGYPYDRTGSRLGGEIRRWLMDPGVVARAREPIEVRPTESENRMLADAQRWLRRVYARMQITIECNPSSNHLIGDFASVDEHPALRLQPMREVGEDETVMVSINSDDPLTFATRLTDEYAHMYAALLRAGVSTQDALAWIDRVRQNGVRSRFTLAASARRGPLRTLLERLHRTVEGR